MPDARLPPEVTQSGDSPRPKGLRLGEADIIAAARLEVLGDGSLKEALATSSPADIGVAPRAQNALVEPAAEIAPAAEGGNFDELQPMLDLRFPEAAMPPVVSLDNAQDADSPPPVSATASAAPESPVPTPLDQPSEAVRSPPAEIVVEVSPIFSALDAADRASMHAQHRHAFAEARPGILLPAQPQFTGAQRLQPPPPPEPDQLPVEATTDTPEWAVEPEPEPASQQDEPATEDEAHGATAAQIAVEANATAEALENLKRLLSHDMPLTGTASPPAPAAFAAEPAAFDREPDPAPSFATPPPFRPAYAANAEEEPEPVTPPPMIPLPPAATMAELRSAEVPRRRAGRVVASFLGGFALSWVFGAVLYVYLNMV